ncbi:MAG: hypothetical protein IJ633_09430 [Prevotella sp.]|nr:hypothetical protein [Prevotella sp.]
MNKSPLIFHGEWWVPAKVDPQNSMFHTMPEGFERKYTGTLSFDEEKGAILETYLVPSYYSAHYYKYNDVIWGKDANQMIYTLFNVVMQDKPLGDFTKTTFDVGLILIGDHVTSLDEVNFRECVVQFPFLRNWAFHNNLTYKEESNNDCYILSVGCQGKPLIEVEMDDEINWILRGRYQKIENDYDLTITQVTEFLIKSQGFSIRKCVQQIGEFAQFLSIALYCDQSPTEILLINREETRRSKLLFKGQKSIEPQKNNLIDFNKLKEKVPSMLKVWHENYEKISPISDYLIDSLKEKTVFDAPDFLIIAQALDGYFKRFVNKKGKDIRKYQNEIEKLLKQFSDISVVQKCHIDPIVLTDTRNKYSHLYPDNEKSQALDRDDLYWITEKCKILLTCCILNMLGLTNDEINLCCNNSPIMDFIESSPFEFD